MLLTKDQLLSGAPELKEVEIPEKGGSVYIRALTLAEQGRLVDMARANEGKKNSGFLALEQLATTITWVVCDQQGNPFLSKEDAKELMNQSASISGRLQDAIIEFSGLTKESRELLEKNLLTMRSEGPASS